MEPHRFAGRRVVQPVPAGEHTGLHGQREPKIRLLPAGFADKAWRRDTDEGQNRFVQSEGLAEYIGTAAEPVLPEVGANDGGWRLDAVLGRSEYPADCRANAQRLKESTRYQAAARFFPLAAVEADLPVAEAAL